MLKKIALIGQPNVGKSSLFNRIVKRRIAIVSDISGTTRDIKKYETTILEKSAIVMDTGGIEETKHLIFSHVKDYALRTAKEADIILFLVDGKKMLDDKDRELFYELQKLGKDIALVINKIDNDKELERTWNFYSLGVDKNLMFPISVSHNRGTRKLFAWISDKLPDLQPQDIIDDDIAIEEFLENDKADTNTNDIKVAIIGKVNVGKSSILNAIVGEERSVVSEIAGTTIDPVDESMEYQNHNITFVDTAGLRRRGKIEGIEKYALMRTKDMLEKANLALVVIDASKPITDQDEKIAGLVDKFGLGTIIVLNKWDEKLYDFKKSEAEIRRRFKFLYYAKIIAVSALTLRSIDRLRDSIVDIYQNYSKRLPTSKLNNLIEEAVKRHSLPSPNGNMLRIYYATQFAIKPPTIALVMNKPQMLHFSYKRYLINFLRDNLTFDGTPIHIVARKKGDRDDNK